MQHLLPSSTGLLAAISGAAWLIPAIAAKMERGALHTQEYAVASVGLVFLVGGVLAGMEIARSFI